MLMRVRGWDGGRETDSIIVPTLKDNMMSVERENRCVSVHMQSQQSLP